MTDQCHTLPFENFALQREGGIHQPQTGGFPSFPIKLRPFRSVYLMAPLGRVGLLGVLNPSSHPGFPQPRTEGNLVFIFTWFHLRDARFYRVLLQPLTDGTSALELLFHPKSPENFASQHPR